MMRAVAAAPEVAPLTPGTQVGDYVIVERIGKGGMGEVFAADDGKLRRRVAIKLLPQDFADDASRKVRFEREAEVLAALNHPGIVTVYGVGEHKGRPYLAMELVRGKPIADVIGGKGLPVAQMLRLGVELADAIAAAHKSGVIHRDLKPQNLMLTDDGRLKVLDFGLAKVERAASSEGPTATATVEGRVLGTIAYMSPEQARGEAADARSDLFAAGIVLYEMATGVRPFAGDTQITLLSSILKDEPLDPTRRNRALPPGFARVIRRCLAKDPEQRYQSALDLRNDLEELRGQSSRRSSRGLGAVMLAGVAAVAFVAGNRIHRRAPQPPSSGRLVVDSLVQLTNDPGADSEASLSPDGTWFVYAGQREGRWHIFRQRVGGENAQDLTPDTKDVDNRAPAISPDGERIAFRSSRQGGGIFIMGSTGEAPRRVTDGWFDPQWSADGRSLVVSSDFIEDVRYLNSAARLATVDVETGTVRPIPVPMMMSYEPSLSPAGDQVAFLCSEHGQRDICLTDLAGKNVRNLTNDRAYDWRPTWRPDGGLVYASSRAGGMNLFVRTGGGEPSALTIGAARWMTGARFSRDGRRMVFVAGQQENAIERVRFDSTHETISVPAVVGMGWFPRISHGRVAYVDVTRGEDITVVDEAGRHRLTDVPEVRNRHPDFSSDGQKVLFASNRANGYNLYRVSVDGRGLEQLTQGDELTTPRASPDGKRAIATSVTKGVVLFDLAHPDQRKNLPSYGPEIPFVASWRPDSRAFTARMGGSSTDAYLYDLDTGKWQLLVKDVNDEVAFLPDGKRAIFSRRNQLLLLELATGRTKVLLTLRGTVENPDVSETGDEIVYAHGEWPSDVWMATLKQEQNQ
jgi:serine/threonine protein kinase/Tol biopolymer transport system component